jgi:hypothetical protein
MRITKNQDVKWSKLNWLQIRVQCQAYVIRVKNFESPRNEVNGE